MPDSVTAGSKYSLDTSVLVNSWWRYYPPDVFPSVWAQLDRLVRDGVVIASEEVLFDLEKKDDEVLGWAKDRRSMFVPSGTDVQLKVREILGSFKRLVDTRKNRSASDPFVIAVALCMKCKVATYEIPSNNQARPHIPDVCDAFGIKCVNLVELLREQGGII